MTFDFTWKEHGKLRVHLLRTCYDRAVSNAHRAGGTGDIVKEGFPRPIWQVAFDFVRRGL